MSRSPGSRPRRLLRHACMWPWSARRRFPAAVLDAIEAQVVRSEQRHGAEIRVAIETALSPAAILAGQAPRERALEVFGALRVWDTAASNGVLVYLLLADRAVEIVADREAARRIARPVWEHACRILSEACRSGREADGMRQALEVLDEALAGAFAAGPDDRDELPNRPVVI